MQHGGENLFRAQFQRLDGVRSFFGVQVVHARVEQSAVVLAERLRRTHAAARFERRAVRARGVGGGARDERADVRGDVRDVLRDARRLERALQHAEQLALHPRVHDQQARGRAPLPRGLRERTQNRVAGLLGERRRVHHQRVEPARLRHQPRERRVAFRGRRGESQVDVRGDFRGANEGDTRESAGGDERGPRVFFFFFAGFFASGVHHHSDGVVLRAGAAQNVRQRERALGRRRVRLDHHGVPRDERAARETPHDGEREVERPDAQPRPARLRAERARLAGDRPKGRRRRQSLPGAPRVEAEKVDALAHLVHGVHQRLARLLHDQLRHGGRVLLDQIRGALQRLRAAQDARGHRIPGNRARR